MQLEIELTSLRKENDDASAERREAIERELAELSERSAAMKAQWQSEKDAIEGVSRDSRSASSRPASRPSAPSAKPTSSAPPSCATARSPSSRRQLAERESAERDARRGRRTRRPRVPQRGGRRRRRRRGRRALDRASPSSRLLEGETEKLIHMEERLHERVVGQDEAIEAVATALRRSRAGPAGPRPPDRLVPVPRPDRRRQDRAGARARRVHVRLPGRDDPHRHVRVHGETLRLAARRRAPRLRRLRRGRPADRGGPPPPLLGRAARRDREGPPRRLQHAAAGDGRRAPDRRPGPHRRLQEHRPDHDLEHPRWRGRDRRAGADDAELRAARCSSTSSPSSSTASTTSSASTRSTREQISRDRRPAGRARDRARRRARRRR